MKILIFLLIISITLSLSKKKKHHRSTSSESSGESSIDTKEDKNISSYDKKDVLNYAGILRQSFALEIASQVPLRNVICSPVSALLPLGKLALGAEGRTHRELLKMIGDPGNKELSTSFKKLIKNLKYLPGVKLNLASRIYVSDKARIQKKFIKASKKVFDSGVEQISFSNPNHAADEINGWVSRQTNAMIPLLLTPNQISLDTSLIIVNAVYFKGIWQEPFTNVRVGKFYVSSGEEHSQLMMSREGEYRYAKSNVLNAQIIEIPYEGKAASFIIVLPFEKNGLSIMLYQLKLAPNLLNEALDKLRKKKVSLTIPKFTITTTLDLKDLYKKIGMENIFSGQSGLTGIVDDEELKLTDAVQKAVIEVHERGTEAAAASAVIVGLSAKQDIEDKKTFLADHPFLFYVIGNGEQLFSGIFTGNLVFVAAYPNRTVFRADHPFLYYVRANREQLFAGTYSVP